MNKWIATAVGVTTLIGILFGIDARYLHQAEAAEAFQQAGIERERGEFVEHHFHIDPHSPTRFDLLIRLDRFSTTHVVDLITCAMKAREITY